MTTTTSDTLRYKFLVHAQRDAGLNLEEAELIADFFTAVGDGMLEKLTPLLIGYRERIADQIRGEVVETILERLERIGNFSFSKRMVIDLVKTYLPKEEENISHRGSRNEQGIRQFSSINRSADSAEQARK